MLDEKPDRMDEQVVETASATWCLVANVLVERPHGVGGAETRRGTKHFKPAAKVYVVGAFWGMGAETVVVVGQHRKSRRYIRLSMKSAHLTNWRVALVRSPSVLARISAPLVGGASSTSGATREPLDAIAVSFAAQSVPQPATTRPRRS